MTSQETKNARPLLKPTMTSQETKADDIVQSAPFLEEISKREINSLELHRYPGPISLIDSDEKMGDALKKLRKEGVLGFDTETRPAFKKGQSYLPSLVQLCGEERVYVFQLEGLLSKRPLFNLLSDKDIRKVGVAMDYDVRQLLEHQKFHPAGFVNLETLADQIGIKNNGLRALTAIVLGFRISKSEQRSNWSRKELSERQITYAATDAWVSREIYLRLDKELRHRENGN